MTRLLKNQQDLQRRPNNIYPVNFARPAQGFQVIVSSQEVHRQASIFQTTIGSKPNMSHWIQLNVDASRLAALRRL
jgi:hypothetical protein